METGKLYLVPTPVGNLEDITLRALQVLKDVDVIYAEDTRTSSVLLKKYGITTHMESYHKFNEHKKTESVCNKILEGQSAALITDAGSPGISDPGYLVTRDCIDTLYRLPQRCKNYLDITQKGHIIYIFHIVLEFLLPSNSIASVDLCESTQPWTNIMTMFLLAIITR